MKLLAFIPIKLTLLLILGILIGRYVFIDQTCLLASTASLLVLLAILFIFEKKTNSILFGLVTALTVISLGAYNYSKAQPIHHLTHYSSLKIEDTKLWTLKINEVLKSNLFSNRYIARVRGVADTSVTGLILVNIALDSTDQILKVDDEIMIFSKAEPIKPPLNPYQFNYKNYLENLGVYHQIRTTPTSFIKNDNPTKTIVGTASSARNHIISKLRQANFGSDELGVIQALLLGQRADISAETYSDYQKAGAVHILAVSGLHIGILLVLIQFFLRPLKYLPRGRTLVLICSVVFIWGYAFVAGMSPSITRATTMFTFVAYALYLNRPSNSFNILALSVLFILLFINPNLLFQVGFQMSYAAVFAILWIFPLLQKFWFPKNKIVRYFWQLLCVSIAAQIGVLPINLFYFHQFPGLFFISNLLIIPALGMILGVGILIIFLALVDWLPSQIVWAYNEVIGQINGLIAWVAQQERFIFQSVSFDFIQLLLSFLILILFINVLTKFSYKPIVHFLLGLICFQGWTLYQQNESGRKAEVLILHQTKNSILFHRNGRELAVLTNNKTKVENIAEDYYIGERIKAISYDPLLNSYTIHNKSLLVIDSTGTYAPSVSNHHILMTQSPKINLERLIETSHPNQIIADGSNYTSYINHWKSTCLKHKIPFHYTGEKGAYYFK